MIGSVASLVGVGGAPLMSIRMGEGDARGARAVLANCFLLICLFAAALMALVIPLRRPMLTLFGASADTLPFADEYFLYYMTGTVFALLATGMNSFVVAQGFAKKAMISVVLGAVMNIVLDPLFIFALDMGVRGAAIATVLSQVASCAYVLVFLFGRRAQVPITFGGYRLRIARRVLALGFTPFSIVAVDNVMIIAMNAVLQRYGGAGQGDLLITVATIVQSFMLVVTMPLGRHQRRHAGHPQLQLRRAARRPRDAGAAAHLPLVPRLHGADVRAGAPCGTAVRAAVHVGSDGCGQVRVGDRRLYAGADSARAAVRDRRRLYGNRSGALPWPLSFWRKAVYFAALFALPAMFGAEAAFYAEAISDVAGPAVSIAVHALVMKKLLARRAMEQVPPVSESA